MDRSALKPAPSLDVLRAQREDILALAARYHVRNVRVFGSVARGEATPESDIDLLVEFGEEASLFDLSGFWLDLEDLLNHKVDVISDYPGMRPRFRQRVLRDAVPL